MDTETGGRQWATLFRLIENYGFPRYEVLAKFSHKPQTIIRLNEETWGFE
jgi:hypothetical protein